MQVTLLSRLRQCRLCLWLAYPSIVKMGKPSYHNTSIASGKVTKLAGPTWKLRPLTL